MEAGFYGDVGRVVGVFRKLSVSTWMGDLVV